MGHLSRSLSEHLQGIAGAIASFSSSILDHVTLKRRGNEDSDEDDDDFDSIDIDPCEAVLERVKVKRIGKYVEAIRAKTQPSDKKNIPVVEVGSPSCSWDQVCYKVKLADGVSWILKVPAIGTPDQFDEDDAEALRSEALTMIMLRRETTITIPEVFSYNNTCKNKLKVPFILMEFIDGRHLEDVWHDRESPKEVVQARRTRCLQDIASAYLQLGKYTFNESTPLRFDDQDRLIGAVPVNNDPFSGLREAYTSRLDRWVKGKNEFDGGLLKLLRMFADWTPESSSGKSFVLTHPNPNIFNFLVSDDGSVRAILDWHGAEAEPPSIGNEIYPLWLMRDWDPTVYIWNEEMEQGIHDENYVWEDSPDTLEFYRNVYAKCIANLQPESDNAKVTRNSPLFQHLMMAMGGSMFSLGITRKIFLEVMKRVEKNVDDNTWPFKPSNNDKKDDKDSKNHSSSKEEDATGYHNSPNETEDQAEHGGIEADIDGEDENELIDIYEFVKALDKDGLCEHRQKLLKAGFDALFIR
ncbi:Aminoglycoside phosphotransferase [Penicillium samsonianum]|uniref:Aminoglycoside phosphotransferase n=1 Tax=Penicillium samsonianum TaxID=1882272 RepID=UPI002547FEEC|nr:Aminoglycoside phosphotransferase [Penicillium samsonianum]KAJ6118151.1 Aminoglycoside phosphotransferase [Penicillium samsonianum]